MIFSYADLLSGDPLYLEGVGHLISPRLSQLKPTNGIGWVLYSLYIRIFLWEKDTFFGYAKDAGLYGLNAFKGKEDALSLFDILTLIQPVRALITSALSFFIAEDVSWDDKERHFVCSKKEGENKEAIGFVNRDNYEKVCEAILALNYVGLDKMKAPKETTFANEKAKELWERAQEFKKKVGSTGKGSEYYEIGNVISKLCAGHPSYNLLNVYELTVFQLYDQFAQYDYLRAIWLNEAIFSNHGGESFNREDWLKPITTNK